MVISTAALAVVVPACDDGDALPRAHGGSAGMSTSGGKAGTGGASTAGNDGNDTAGSNSSGASSGGENGGEGGEDGEGLGGAAGEATTGGVGNGSGGISGTGGMAAGGSTAAGGVAGTAGAATGGTAGNAAGSGGTTAGGAASGGAGSGGTDGSLCGGCAVYTVPFTVSRNQAAQIVFDTPTDLTGASVVFRVHTAGGSADTKLYIYAQNGSAQNYAADYSKQSANLLSALSSGFTDVTYAVPAATGDWTPTVVTTLQVVFESGAGPWPTAPSVTIDSVAFTGLTTQPLAGGLTAPWQFTSASAPLTINQYNPGPPSSVPVGTAVTFQP
ncbi:MAG TPA: hypothetical protein VFK05_02640 [Polyangiaceae bacterium]|nr:hypothetical protein [Polyangiaceae bacterium]